MVDRVGPGPTTGMTAPTATPTAEGVRFATIYSVYATTQRAGWSITRGGTARLRTCPGPTSTTLCQSTSNTTTSLSRTKIIACTAACARLTTRPTSQGITLVGRSCISAVVADQDFTVADIATRCITD